MEFKIDTKEKFTVIQPLETGISANMSANLKKACLECLDKEVKNVILKLDKVSTISIQAAREIVELQQSFYEGSASFVICQMQPSVLKVFEDEELDDMLNQTPTESEAWDIVQMEEIERELLDGEDFNFQKNNLLASENKLSL